MKQYGLFVLWFQWGLSTQQSNELKNICKLEKALFIQIETNSYNEDTIDLNWFTEWYYKKFITPYTAVIDLTKDIEFILANMKPKGRYNIKLSDKKWVEGKIVEKTDSNIQDFFNLMNQTTSRDNFSWNTVDYYKNFLKTLT
jgi:lipid II:glycine glycyltransferase (peptidoglycan interpeptide bridge formation enzyme)